MSPRFLKTKIPVANLDKVERLKDQLGREPEDHEIDLSFAEIVIDLLDVEAVRQSFKDDELVEDEAAVYVLGEIFYCQTPYREVLDLWLAVKGGEVDQKAPSQDVGQAVRTLALALDEDRAEGSLYYGYQANIAMSFVDEYVAQAGEDDIKKIANDGARRFLDMLINSTK